MIRLKYLKRLKSLISKEVEKFKSDMDGVSNKAKAAGTLFGKRLDDTLASEKRDISSRLKEMSLTPGGKAGSE